MMHPNILLTILSTFIGALLALWAGYLLRKHYIKLSNKNDAINLLIDMTKELSDLIEKHRNGNDDNRNILNKQTALSSLLYFMSKKYDLKEISLVPFFLTLETYYQENENNIKDWSVRTQQEETKLITKLWDNKL